MIEAGSFGLIAADPIEPEMIEGVALPRSIWAALKSEANAVDLTIGEAVGMILTRVYNERHAPKPAQPARRSSQTPKRQLKVAS
jgi:hypothetical protein